MTTDEAIEIVARGIAAHAATSTFYGSWENYPEIGAYHWKRIEDRIGELLPDVPGEAFAEAYDHLQNLAEGSES